MGKDPAFLFYSADFLVGVTELTMEERGQYITLLCLQHQKGHLSARTVRGVAPTEAVLDKFLRDAKGRYYNERLDEEKRKRENFIKSKVENGKKGGRPPKNLSESYSFSTAKLQESYSEPTENLPENENVNGFNTLVINSTKAVSSDEAIDSTTFSFSDTTTTTNVGDTGARPRRLVDDGERDEHGLTMTEYGIIVDFFEDETGEDSVFNTVVNDMVDDFVAYNKSKGWRGIGGEDVRRDLKRYLRRWIEEERAKKSKYRKDV